MLRTSPITSPSATKSPTASFRRPPSASSQAHATDPTRQTSASTSTTSSTGTPDASSPKLHHRTLGSLPGAASATSPTPLTEYSGASKATGPSEPVLSQRDWDSLALASTSTSTSNPNSNSASISASISVSSSALASASTSALVPIAANSSSASAAPSAAAYSSSCSSSSYSAFLTDSSTAAEQDASPAPAESHPMTTATAGGGAPPPPPPQQQQHTCPAAAQLQNPASPHNKRRGHPSMHDITHDTAHDPANVAQAHCAAGTDRPSGHLTSPPNAPGTLSSSSSSAKRAKPDEPAAKVLPLKYELCHVDDMVQLIAHMLGELITTNDAIRISNGGLTRFHSRTAPGISVRDYLHRLARHATLTPPLLLAMVYYIDRLCALYPEFTINTLTVHRFLITAATVAAKGLSDSFWNNSTYARVGGVRVAELKLLELEFLYRVDWKIVPNPDVLVAYYQGLVHRCPGYKCEPGDEDGDGEGEGQGGEEDEEEMTG